MAWTEKAGVPAVAVICPDFEPSARITAKALGLPEMRLVTYPSRRKIGDQSREEIDKCAAGMLDRIAAALTGSLVTPRARVNSAQSRSTKQIVFRGSLDEVNELFHSYRWTDGLPIIPPTVEAVEAMLRFTDRAPDGMVGELPPTMGLATVWKIAVNGVMAGCRPEYMPVLIAVVMAIADPRFGLKHAGSTLGWTPMIILNGPIVQQLGFNSGLGVLRPRTQANMAVGRFLHLCLGNIAGYSLGTTDMGTFGNSYYGVLAEAEDQSPWEPLSADRGFRAGSNVVTVFSVADMSYHFYTIGDAERHLREVAREVARELGGPPIVALVRFGPEWAPVICITPLLASLLDTAGYSKSAVRQYVYEHARIPAGQLEEQMQHLEPGFTVSDAVERGRLGAAFGTGDDPGRLIPVAHSPDEFQLVVSGHANHIRSMVIAQLGFMGLTVSKEILLPANWGQLIEKQKERTPPGGVD